MIQQQLERVLGITLFLNTSKKIQIARSYLMVMEAMKSAVVIFICEMLLVQKNCS